MRRGAASLVRVAMRDTDRRHTDEHIAMPWSRRLDLFRHEHMRPAVRVDAYRLHVSNPLVERLSYTAVCGLQGERALAWPSEATPVVKRPPASQHRIYRSFEIVTLCG